MRFQWRGRSFGKTEAIRKALIDQWIVNHFEHCGREIKPPYPHSGECYWPLPKELTLKDATRILDGLPK